MSDLILLILQYIAPVVIGAILTYFLTPKKKAQDLLSEDIEETSKPDGSTTKKLKRRYK
jgi:hypothetical protein